MAVQLLVSYFFAPAEHPVRQAQYVVMQQAAPVAPFHQLIRRGGYARCRQTVRPIGQPPLFGGLPEAAWQAFAARIEDGKVGPDTYCRFMPREEQVAKGGLTLAQHQSVMEPLTQQLLQPRKHGRRHPVLRMRAQAVCEAGSMVVRKRYPASSLDGVFDTEK